MTTISQDIYDSRGVDINAGLKPDISKHKVLM